MIRVTSTFTGPFFTHVLSSACGIFLFSNALVSLIVVLKLSLVESIVGCFTRIFHWMMRNYRAPKNHDAVDMISQSILL